MTAFHSDLAIGRFILKFSFGPRLTRVVNRFPRKAPDAPVDMLIDDVFVRSAAGAPDVTLRIYRPRSIAGDTPALCWMHGGGFVQGHPEQDEGMSIDFARTLGITVATVRYRLGPRHPSPAAIEDAYSGLRWLFAHAAERGIDAQRIAVGGQAPAEGWRPASRCTHTIRVR